jgi:hypothetical protein
MILKMRDLQLFRRKKHELIFGNKFLRNINNIITTTVIKWVFVVVHFTTYFIIIEINLVAVV